MRPIDLCSIIQHFYFDGINQDLRELRYLKVGRMKIAGPTIPTWLFHMGKTIIVDELSTSMNSKPPDFQLCFQTVGAKLTLGINVMMHISQ